MRFQRTTVAVVGSVVLGIGTGAAAFGQNPVGGNGGSGGGGAAGGAAGSSTIVSTSSISCGDGCKAPQRTKSSIRGTSNGGPGGNGGHGGPGGTGINRF